jgi:hypothetical protein
MNVQKQSLNTHTHTPGLLDKDLTETVKKYVQKLKKKNQRNN